MKRVLNIPESIVIHGKVWKIHRDSKNLKAADAKERKILKKFLGMTYFQTREIYVAGHLTDTGASITLIHEMLHASAGNEHSSKWDKFEERFIKCVDRIFTHALAKLTWKRVK